MHWTNLKQMGRLIGGSIAHAAPVSMTAPANEEAEATEDVVPGMADKWSRLYLTTARGQGRIVLVAQQLYPRKRNDAT